MTHTHEIRIRYGECDMQRVVFNANYFVYCDDAVDTWFRSVLTPTGGTLEDSGFDFMLKRAEITWHAPLRFGETAQLDCSVARWGTTSFDVLVDGRVGDVAKFSATIVYVSVVVGGHAPTPVPPRVRELLGG